MAQTDTTARRFDEEVAVDQSLETIKPFIGRIAARQDDLLTSEVIPFGCSQRDDRVHQTSCGAEIPAFAIDLLVKPFARGGLDHGHKKLTAGHPTEHFFLLVSRHSAEDAKPLRPIERVQKGLNVFVAKEGHDEFDEGN